MAYWNKNWEVGVDAIDAQHKRLIDLFNELHDAMPAGIGEEKFAKVLAELKEYTVYHFGVEEDLFKQYGYADAAIHIEAHKYFIQKVDGLLKAFKSHEPEVIRETFDFLKDWLINHIVKTDKQYVPFLRSKGIK